MILHAIADLLIPYLENQWEELSLTLGGTIFVLETPDWCIYMSPDDVLFFQYDKRESIWAMVQVETCPDIYQIAIKMLEILSMEYQKEVCK
jgi:hypothetical protein